MVVQAYVKISAACTCTVAGSIRVTGGVAGRYRAVGVVACLRISHCFDILDTKQNKKEDWQLECGWEAGSSCVVLLWSLRRGKTLFCPCIKCDLVWSNMRNTALSID